MVGVVRSCANSLHYCLCVSCLHGCGLMTKSECVGVTLIVVTMLQTHPLLHSPLSQSSSNEMQKVQLV